MGWRRRCLVVVLVVGCCRRGSLGHKYKRFFIKWLGLVLVYAWAFPRYLGLSYRAAWGRLGPSGMPARPPV